jgi:hypothetical protein
VSVLQRVRALIPPWEMPSERKLAVGWFLQWLLKLVANFFWLPLLAVVIYTVYADSMTSGIRAGMFNGMTTLLWGIVFWVILYGIMSTVGILTRIARFASDIRKMQKQQDDLLSQFNSPFMDAGAGMDMNDMDTIMGRTGERQRSNRRIVEGTITDIHEDPPQ